MCVVVTAQGLARKFELVLPHLDERQWRLVTGAEARERRLGSPPWWRRKHLSEKDPGPLGPLAALVDSATLRPLRSRGQRSRYD